MSEILSQNEINELLQSIKNEEVNQGQESVKSFGKRIRDYDFKTPKKFTKEQVKIVMGIYENFSRQLASYLSGILRTYCEISIVSIEEQHYYEYNNALPDSILIGVIEANPIEGPMLVDISNSITYNLIERMLGSGERQSSIVLNREYTEIEISLMERIFRQIAVFTKEAWSGLIKMDAVLKSIETNSRLIQSISMDEIVVLVILDVSINNIKGTINFCIPCINIEALLDKINQNKFVSKRSIDPSVEEFIKESMVFRLKEAKLEMRAIFGETVLSLNEVLNLQVGDVIKIDQDIGSQVKLNINTGDTWFYGIPGTRKNKKSIKISRVLQKRGSVFNDQQHG